MLEKIQADLNQALKDRDEIKVSTLRLLIGAVRNYAIAKESTSYTPSDEEIISVIQSQAKQRRDSIEQFKAGGRTELVEKETKELAILQSYLPEQLSGDEVKVLVEQKLKELGTTSVADMGKVMGVLSSELKGKADMGLVSAIVRKKLAG